MTAPALPPAAIATSTSPVRTPLWFLTYEGRDVTRDLADAMLEVTYVDHEHGKSDEMELRLRNDDGRWWDAWRPARGDRLTLQIGYQGEPLLDCGRFEIDELESSGPPDVVVIRGLATGIRHPLRTKRSAAYEGQTLRQVAEAVARRHAYTVVGAVDAISAIRIGRLTQDEPDLTFLRRLAERFGFVFSVRADALVFYELSALEGRAPVFRVEPRAISQYTFLAKATRAYGSAEVRYDDPIGRREITRTVAADAVPWSGARADVLKLGTRVESGEQGDVVARAALRRANGRDLGARLNLSGEPRLVAGVNLLVDGWGAYAGTYHVETSRHRLSRAGYSTEIEARWLRAPQAGARAAGGTPV